MPQNANERAVRRTAIDLYGCSMIDTIERVEDDAWQIKLMDGGISCATIQDDGSVLIEPE